MVCGSFGHRVSDTSSHERRITVSCSAVGGGGGPTITVVADEEIMLMLERLRSSDTKLLAEEVAVIDNKYCETMMAIEEKTKKRTKEMYEIGVMLDRGIFIDLMFFCSVYAKTEVQTG